MVIAERLPPFDVEAEEAVLASLMVDEDAIYKVHSIVRPEDFQREQNRWTYEACRALLERDEPVNQITVAHELARRGRLEEAGGPGFLSRIVAELPTPIGVEHYARIVQRDSIYRNLIFASSQIANMAYEGGPRLEEVLSRAAELILSLRGEEYRDFVHIRQLLEQYLEAPGIDAVGAGLIGHIRTGFVDLDTLLGGLKRSDLILVAARPSLGKTSLALNIARNAAIGQGARVAIFSLEMAAEQLAQRLLAGESGVDSTRLRLGEHTEAEERRIMHAMGVLADAEIYIDDTGFQRPADIRTKAKRLHRERPLDLIIVDYLQLMQGPAGRSDSKVAEVTDISRALKQLARELDVPVIACSQLSRAPEQRVPHIPMLSDLRESGSLEQDADVVVFIYREDVYVTEEQWQGLHADEPYPEGKAQIIVAKHRNGPTRTVHLRFRKNLTRFEDWEVLRPQTEYA
ncbi:MAG: replicative DNA helicase [Chloroflexi bacterium RBG_16_68_14]|nr:MAG: replicative DNA helicase [Chloroflexi bacterium RBG_16_68_14]